MVYSALVKLSDLVSSDPHKQQSQELLDTELDSSITRSWRDPFSVSVIFQSCMFINLLCSYAVVLSRDEFYATQNTDVLHCKLFS